MRFTRVDYTTIGPSGVVYNTSSDSFLVGETVGLGRFGCFFTYRDADITRPVATTYRITYQYSDAGGQSATTTVSGNISSTVPPQPFITAVTLTDDINDPQKIIRQRRPVTFTVTHVEGGTPPFLYQWRLSGVTLRDWDPDPVLIWDGETLGNARAASGGHTLAVSVRRSTWKEAEAGASVSFVLF